MRHRTALMQYIMPREVFENNSIAISRGANASQKDLCLSLEMMGYSRTEIVEGVGQFSVRGGIVDVFTPNYSYPVRIDFFGDEIDLIGFFDMVSQRRTENVEKVTVIPCNEMILSVNTRKTVADEIKKLINEFVGPEKRRQVLFSELEMVEKGEKSLFSDKYFSLLSKEYYI